MKRRQGWEERERERERERLGRMRWEEGEGRGDESHSDTFCQYCAVQLRLDCLRRTSPHFTKSHLVPNPPRK